ncbi:MAG TPA: hypothetical protein VGY31_01135 [Terriglobia bacterium]|nr:hypothetical protein [Terriglobia bacterium]
MPPLIAVTFAPGMTLPCASSTVPVMDPLIVWPPMLAKNPRIAKKAHVNQKARCAGNCRFMTDLHNWNCACEY